MDDGREVTGWSDLAEIGLCGCPWWWIPSLLCQFNLSAIYTNPDWIEIKDWMDKGIWKWLWFDQVWKWWSDGSFVVVEFLERWRGGTGEASGCNLKCFVDNSKNFKFLVCESALSRIETRISKHAAPKRIKKTKIKIKIKINENVMNVQ